MDGCVNGRGTEIDWKVIGIRFRQMGYGISDVSRALNLPFTTVASWFNYGVEPRYSSGMLLIGLYREVQASHKTNKLYESASVYEIS